MFLVAYVYVDLSCPSEGPVPEQTGPSYAQSPYEHCPCKHCLSQTFQEHP